MTPAEAQETVIRAGLPAELRMKEYQRHGATLETVAKRLEAIRQMRDFVARVRPETDADDLELLRAFEEATREEVGYWMEVYVATAPRMIAARRGAELAFGELDRVQAEVMAKFREIEQQRKGGGQ